jgi:hypothetical protein
MYVPTDIFNHSSHVSRIGGNQSCAECHQASLAVKNRTTAKACSRCHMERTVVDPIIMIPAKQKAGYAVGYMDAMHNLCIRCHERQVQQDPSNFHRSFAECAHCHRDFDLSLLEKMEPYKAIGSRM